MNMNGYIRLATVVAVLFFAGTVRMQAQTVKGQSPDSLALSMSTVMDSTLMGKSIFSILPGSGRNGSQSVVSVNQSDAVLKALNSHIAANSERKLSGYRVRIFSDNKQNARTASEAALEKRASRSRAWRPSRASSPVVRPIAPTPILSSR